MQVCARQPKPEASFRQIENTGSRIGAEPFSHRVQDLRDVCRRSLETVPRGVTSG